MRKTLLTIIAVCAAMVAVQGQTLEEKVEKTLSRMTLDEKTVRRCALFCNSMADRMKR